MVAQKKKLMHVFNETDKQASIVQEDVCFKETEKKTFLIQEDFKKTHVFWSQQSTPFTVSQASRACRVLARSEAIGSQHDDLLAKLVARWMMCL
jgi:hypothetical protein